MRGYSVYHHTEKRRYHIVAIATIAIFLLSNFLSLSAQTNTIQTLQSTIDRKRETIERLRREISVYEQSIRLRQSQAASLSNQIAIINDQIQRLELSMKLTEEEIDETSIEIAQTEGLIAQHEQSLLLKRTELAANLRYLKQREEMNEIFILLIHDRLSSYYHDIKNIEQLQSSLASTVEEYDRLKKEAELQYATLTAKQDELLALKSRLEEQQLQLGSQRSVKAQLLVDTRRSETKYFSLLESAKREQNTIEAEVSSIEKKLRKEMQKGERLKKLQSLGSTQFLWPVTPNIITAYFHDPDYPYRYIFEHPAIDIKAAFKSPVHAAASGYVGKAKDAGMGYSYVMIIHNDDYATVYGHLSKILVRDDEFVTQGQVIGLSGGTPGTPGAGRLTTGPHLHFEIRQQGIPINPLDYLP
ncbi:MAG: peptidoglycan DD-metalloendopeptidase family protein [Patescibacteria group bacterium]